MLLRTENGVPIGDDNPLAVTGELALADAAGLGLDSTLQNILDALGLAIGPKLLSGEKESDRLLTVETRWTPVAVPAATTTQVATGACVAGNMFFLGSGNLTIYDNTVSTGTPILPATAITGPFFLTSGWKFATGLRIVTTGTLLGVVGLGQGVR